ncbi:MAG: futalosine hydrolase [Limisphaerales bacterium]|jgi:futalosine hydrolase
MKILLLAATAIEIQPCIDRMKLAPSSRASVLKGFYEGHHVEALITGVGAIATAYQLGKQLTGNYYDLVLNLGIAGTYNDSFPLGSICNVTVEEFADLGAEDGVRFLDQFDLGLLGRDEFPYIDGKLANPLQPNATLLAHLPKAHGLTVNKVHGYQVSIDRLLKKYSADIESMEGAAVFYVCLHEKQNFAQVRAISNKVERRNKQNWKMAAAIESLNDFAIEYIYKLKG